MQEGSRRAIAAAFLANFGIALAKFAAFAVTGAASLLAEAIHSVADTGNQGLLFLGGRQAEKAPTRLHPFGYGRERYFWAFVVALVLFSLGAMFALYEGINKLINPHELEDPIVAFAVLGLAVVLEGASLRTAVHEAAKVRRKHSWWGFIRTSKTPELPVVLLEDLGALIGLTFALLGVALTVITGNEVFDALGSCAIGLLLAAIAVVLAIEMKSLLIGESASPEEQQKIADSIESDPSVDRLIHLRTQHLGPEELLVAAKIDFDVPTIEILGRAIDELEARIRTAVPNAHVIYIEPDEYRAPEGDNDPE
ncbi:MAG: cation diffusion facilitator family transporter [Acidimicrobiia bacterium]